jgi:hypothetical protein
MEPSSSWEKSVMGETSSFTSFQAQRAHHDPQHLHGCAGASSVKSGGGVVAISPILPRPTEPELLEGHKGNRAIVITPSQMVVIATEAGVSFVPC